MTVSPLEAGNGATVDTRAGPVIVAGMVGGPVSAIIAAGFGAAARWIYGGSFAFSGAIVFGLYALVGTLLWRRLFSKKLGDDLSWARIMFGVGLSVVAASLMYFLIEPLEVANRWLASTLPYIAAANLV